MKSWMTRRVELDRVDVLAFCLTVAVLFTGALRLASRTYRLERRVSDLENKPCLMMGAHTGCERIER